MSTTATTHTPGPWHVGAANGHGSIFPESGRMRLETKGTTLYPVASIVTGWQADEDEANARLIASAPIRARIEPVIAKATGGTQ